MKKIILVTGGSGLVGQGIKNIKDDYDINYNFIFSSSKDCDLKDYNSTLNYFKQINPEYVFHLAANVGGLFKNMNQKVNMFEDNILINMNVLKAAHECKVEKLIGCLSTCIFPDKTTYPIDETMLHDGPPHDSNDAYAYAKRMLEVECNAYKEQYGDNFMCIIPTNIYGTNDNFHLEDSHVIPGLIHKCYLSKKHNKPFIVSGTGSPLRQFIHNNDLGKLLLWCLLEYKKNDTLILSVPPEDEVSIKDIATLIAKKFDYIDHLTFNTSKSDGQYKKTANNEKLMKLLNNNFDFKSIENGIDETIDWFIENYDKCRK